MNKERFIINKTTTLNAALKQLDEHSADILLLFVVDENNKLVGVLTDGDIRRGLVSGKSIDAPVDQIMNTDFTSANESDNINAVVNQINKSEKKLLPIINAAGEITRIINLLEFKYNLPVDAFIMAGGRGERLKPLTDDVPKPLLKVGGKPIIEHNIDRLVDYGINNIHLSIRYLGDQIKDYFGDGSDRSTTINYITEKDPLGTAGALSLVDNFDKDYILLMNSDLLTNFDLEKMYEEFIEQDADLMVATIPYEVNVPYAVMETEGKRVKSFKEKPTYTFQSNAGIYLMKKSVLEIIPHNSHFNATDLMEKLIELGNAVGFFPIFGYWLDIGKPEDYKKAQEDIKHLKL